MKCLLDSYILFICYGISCAFMLGILFCVCKANEILSYNFCMCIISASYVTFFFFN